MNSATITLPWPDKHLSPNGRFHWTQVARAKKAARCVAHYAVLEARIGKINADCVVVRYSFYPPDRRAYDLDNLGARMKAAADGIADAMGVNDKIFCPVLMPLSPVHKNGKVVVELEWAVHVCGGDG